MPEIDPQGTPNPTAPTVISLEDAERFQVKTKVYGEEQVRSLKDVLAVAQKAEASERKLQDLHEREAELQEARDAFTFIKQGWSGKDGDQLIKGLVKAGIPEADAKRVVYGPETANPHTGGHVADTLDAEDGEDPRIAQLTAAVQLLTQQVSARDTQEKRVTEERTILQQVSEALDKHPELAKIMKTRATTPESKKVFLKKAYQAVAGRRQEFPTMGPRVIQAGLGDLLNELSLLGISTDGPTPPTSLGPTDISESGVHLSGHAKALMDTNEDEDVSLFSDKAPASILRSIAKKAGLLG